ncbi:MAG: InlB B-repeat-containing protein, partial [Minisyncoccia bacterium]
MTANYTVTVTTNSADYMELSLSSGPAGVTLSSNGGCLLVNGSTPTFPITLQTTAGTTPVASAQAFTVLATRYTASGCATAESETVSNNGSLTVASSIGATFNSNFPYVTGGSGSMSVEYFQSGVSKTLTSNAFADTGYTFTGWNTAANGSGTAYTNSQSITIYAGVTLYAQWTINSYTVTFNANGGTGSMSNETEPYNTSTALTTNS